VSVRRSVRESSARPSEAANHAHSQDVEGLRVPRSPYLLVEDVAARYSVSVRWVHERTRSVEPQIPHRRLPGSRRCLFLEAELEAWESGAKLEIGELAGGGRIVRVRTYDGP
jgi:hypothetical protein